MKSKKKVLVTVLCAAALVVASVLGTMAYLTSQTETVTNTFTVGNVEITLDETDVTPMGVKDTDARVKGNEYKLIPGHTYIKDPTVHVDTDSEESWLFVKVVDEIAGIEADTTVAAQMADNGWTAVDRATNVYAYKATVTAGQDIKVFENFTIKGTAAVADYAGKTITVEAYAIQAGGFDTAAAAWEAAPGWN